LEIHIHLVMFQHFNNNVGFGHLCSPNIKAVQPFLS
jgi:hypothetical protein